MPMADVTRCAIYTRKSTEEGLEQQFNSLDAQREACAAYTRTRLARTKALPIDWPTQRQMFGFA